MSIDQRRTEYVCRGCDESECRYSEAHGQKFYTTCDGDIQILHPHHCPFEGYVGKCQWEPASKPRVPAYLDAALNEGTGVYIP